MTSQGCDIKLNDLVGDNVTEQCASFPMRGLFPANSQMPSECYSECLVLTSSSSVEVVCVAFSLLWVFIIIELTEIFSFKGLRDDERVSQRCVL